jgi:phosphinothricin acetyltransferase
MSINVRFARPDDAAGILAIYAPICQSSHVSFEIESPTEDQMRERITRIAADYPWLVAEIDGEVAGYVYASPHRERAAYRWAVDVAVYVAPAYRRRGFARALYECLFKLLRAQRYFKAYAGIALPNGLSVGLHEAVGFRRVAVFPRVGYKLGRWIDVGWWQFDLQPETQHPPEPRPFRQVCDSAAVVAAMSEACANCRAYGYNQD